MDLRSLNNEIDIHYWRWEFNEYRRAMHAQTEFDKNLIIFYRNMYLTPKFFFLKVSLAKYLLIIKGTLRWSFFLWFSPVGLEPLLPG